MKHETIETLQYWRDISECRCLETNPIGACLRCDLEEILKSENNTSKTLQEEFDLAMKRIEKEVVKK